MLRYLFPIFLLLSLFQTAPAGAYGLLTHEALIDASWEKTLVPAIRARYPGLSQTELDSCHAYAYGGAVVPDMGYFPMGSRTFSDLLHYVRNGAFVENMLREAKTPKEYAFALGTLAHYNADRYGHPIGVNPSVVLMFPDKQQENRPFLTYEDDPTAHTRTEFGFDVLQVARGNYSADAYEHFISFEIADDLLKRVFSETYGTGIDSLFRNYGRSVRTFRWGVRDVFPQLTRVAWKSKRKEIREVNPTATARQFHYRMRRAQFAKQFGRDYDRPGPGARFLAGLLHILPKIGPLRVLKPAVPTREAEKLFVTSFDTVILHYRADVVSAPDHRLPDVDWDTGEPSAGGEYALADKAHDDLLIRLQKQGWENAPEALKMDMLFYYARMKRQGSSTVLADDVQAALRDLKAHTNQY